MNIHIPTLLWAAFNFIFLFGIIIGSVYFIFYFIRKVKIMDKRIENIERILMQKNKDD